MSTASDETRFDDSADPKPEWCRQCNKTTRHFDTPEGPKRCPACHPLSHRPLAQHRTCRICLAPVYEWEMRAHLSDIHAITGSNS